MPKFFDLVDPLKQAEQESSFKIKLKKYGQAGSKSRKNRSMSMQGSSIYLKT